MAICFAIIRTYTGSAAYELIDEPIIPWAARNFLAESDDCFAKPSRTLFQVERMTRLTVNLTLFFQDPLVGGRQRVNQRRALR